MKALIFAFLMLLTCNSFAQGKSNIKKITVEFNAVGIELQQLTIMPNNGAPAVILSSDEGLTQTVEIAESDTYVIVAGMVWRDNRQGLRVSWKAGAMDLLPARYYDWNSVNNVFATLKKNDTITFSY